MNPKEKAEIRNILEARKQDLKEVIIDENSVLSSQLNTAESGESQVDFNHPADMVQGDPDYEKEMRIIERQRAELALVNRALSRLDKEDFGTCEECGTEISLARLKAIPYTKFCVECQERLEDLSSDRSSEPMPRTTASARRGRRSPDDARGGNLRSPA